MILIHRATGWLMLLACSAAAQPAITLAEAVREAQENHPRLRAADQRVAVAQGFRLQAGLTLNPRAFLQSENTRFWSSPGLRYPADTDNFAYFSQIFEAGGKRARRIDVATSVVRVTGLERSVVGREVAGRVSLAYWTAAAAGGLRDLLRENVETFERIVEYHRERVREGAMAELDLLRVLLERDRLSVTARTAEIDYEQAVVALQREMGRTDFRPVSLADRIAEPRDLPPPDINSVLAARPEVQAARANVDRARANLRLQQAVATPDPEVLLGYKRTAGYNTLMGGFQINLPVRNRNQGQIAAASAEIRVAENELSAAESQVRAEVAAAWAALDGRRRLLTDTLKPMRDRSDEIARIALAAYREGGMDLLRLIDAQRSRLEALTLYYRALSEYQGSVTTLQIVTGEPL